MTTEPEQPPEPLAGQVPETPPAVKVEEEDVQAVLLDPINAVDDIKDLAESVVNRITTIGFGPFRRMYRDYRDGVVAASDALFDNFSGKKKKRD